jgi:hypothetical protein
MGTVGVGFRCCLSGSARGLRLYRVCASGFGGGLRWDCSGLVLLSRDGCLPLFHTGTGSGPGGTMLLLAWIGGIVTSFNIHPGSNSDSVVYAPASEAPWPEPTARSEHWSLRYALVAYVITFVAANGLGVVLYFGFDLHHLGAGVGVLIVDATEFVGAAQTKARSDAPGSGSTQCSPSRVARAGGSRLHRVRRDHRVLGRCSAPTQLREGSRRMSRTGFDGDVAVEPGPAQTPDTERESVER